MKFGAKDAVIDTKEKQSTSEVVGELAAVVETEADKTDRAPDAIIATEEAKQSPEEI